MRAAALVVVKRLPQHLHARPKYGNTLGIGYARSRRGQLRLKALPHLDQLADDILPITVSDA